MHKKIIILIILLSIAVVAQDNYNSYGTIKVDLKISSSTNMIKTSSTSQIEYISANVSLFPKSSISQNVLSLKTKSNPQAEEIKDKTIIFIWKNPLEHNEFEINSIIESKNTIIPITKKISFPIKDIPPNLEIYTKEASYIDITPNIVNKANQIVAGETDLYEVVYKFADWTKNNIQYNLSTLTADVNQKSSWVLENRQGVCKELSSLFISFLRSIGIPARFVSGVAYTNIDNNFGGHGWAEVYFPNYGWIPFDPTYGQYGWVDPTHIKLSDSIDAADPSIKYNWKAIDVDLKSDKIDINTKIIEAKDEINPLIRLKVIPLISEVGPGSYVPIRVMVENLQDYYLPTTIQITKAPKLIEKLSKSVLLKPKEQKSLFWIVEIPEDIENHYIYTTTIEAIDYFNSLDSAKLNYAKTYQIYSKKEAEDKIAFYTKKEEKIYSTDLYLNCEAGRNYFFTYEDPKIKCNLKNIGTTVISNLNICLEIECNKLNLNIAEEKSLEFKINKSGEIKINAKNDKLDLNNYVNINILKDPNLRISVIATPENIDYYSLINISFILNTDAPVKNIIGSLNSNEIFKIPNLPNSQKIKLNINADSLSSLNDLTLTYQDENSKEYLTSQEFNVVLINPPWYVKVEDFFKSLL